MAAKAKKEEVAELNWDPKKKTSAKLGVANTLRHQVEYVGSIPEFS